MNSQLSPWLSTAKHVETQTAGDAETQLSRGAALHEHRAPCQLPSSSTTACGAHLPAATGPAAGLRAHRTTEAPRAPCVSCTTRGERFSASHSLPEELPYAPRVLLSLFTGMLHEAETFVTR